jgi:glycosyltransferase involved in cell wall biosynthesis
MTPLSILITAHNEPLQEVNNTLTSIRETAGDIEVVLVDDGSQMPLDLEDKTTKLIRMENRCGVGPARNIAASHSTGEFILITDGHVRFEKGWLDAALKRIKDRPTTVFCATCVGLEPGMMDMARAKYSYSAGASINFYGPDRNRPEQTQILESVWNPAREGDDFPIASLMGACYVMSKAWFDFIGGLRLLRGWGSDESLLALKTWLAGGECRAMKCVRIGHQFRQASSYVTPSWQMLWNKMAIAHTCLPTDKAWALCNLFQGGEELTTAKRRLTDDWGLIMAERAYLQSISVRTFDSYLEYFGLTFPQ